MKSPQAERAAERQRRRTERKRKGEMCVSVSVSREVRDELVEAGRLGQWDEDNREAVRAVLQEVIDGLQYVTRDV